MPVLGRSPRARPDPDKRSLVVNESKKHKENREFALAIISEAWNKDYLSPMRALELAFEANGNHGEWTDERVEELANRIGRESIKEAEQKARRIARGQR
jgi:ABC-type oligopeptide transport system substrate-binding subunit